MTEFQECESIADPVLRQFCRGERSTVEGCNHLRQAWGFAPLPECWEIRALGRIAVAAQTAPVAEPGSDCPHRGEELRRIKNTGCQCTGSDFPVYSCGLHGECVARRSAGGDLQDCFGCQIDGKDGGLAFPEGSGLSVARVAQQPMNGGWL